MKFLVPYYSCLQNPWLGATAPRSRSLGPLSLTEFVGLPPEQNSWVRHCLSTKAYQDWDILHTVILHLITNHDPVAFTETNVTAIIMIYIWIMEHHNANRCADIHSLVVLYRYAKVPRINENFF